jgi:hypothetical protein
MVTVDVPVLVPPPKTIELELSEQLMNAEVGAVHVSATVPLNPFLASTVIVELPEPPGAEMLLMVPNIV